MSVVAAKKNEYGEWEIAADSIALCADTIINQKGNRSYAKIKRVGSMIIGGTGNYSDIGLLFIFAKTHVPKDDTEDSVLDWFVEFLDWRSKKVEGYSMDETNFMMLIGGNCFMLEGTLCLKVAKYMAIGAGMDFALTALYLGKSPEEACKAACALSNLCEEPVRMFRLVE